MRKRATKYSILNKRDDGDYIYRSRYQKWRTKVYRRDNYKCQMPGCDHKTKRLNAHHIRRWADSPNLHFSVDNGITLCWKCHKKITGNEDLYANVFMAILNQTTERVLKLLYTDDDEIQGD
jgi:hypothetical protein